MERILATPQGPICWSRLREASEIHPRLQKNRLLGLKISRRCKRPSRSQRSIVSPPKIYRKQRWLRSIGANERNCLRLILAALEKVPAGLTFLVVLAVAKLCYAASSNSKPWPHLTKFSLTFPPLVVLAGEAGA